MNTQYNNIIINFSKPTECHRRRRRKEKRKEKKKKKKCHRNPGEETHLSLSIQNINTNNFLSKSILFSFLTYHSSMN
jgi:hypothetical protein